VATGRRAGDRFLQLARHVPTITTVIDAAERIFPPFDIIDELTKERGLVTSQTVPAMRAPSGNHQ
jgi:PII-like signaling protein